MINIMVKVKKVGITILSNIQVLLLRPKRQVRVDLNLMETTMKEILLMVNLKDKENTTLQILVKSTKENFIRIT